MMIAGCRLPASCFLFPGRPFLRYRGAPACRCPHPATCPAPASRCNDGPVAIRHNSAAEIRVDEGGEPAPRAPVSGPVAAGTPAKKKPAPPAPVAEKPRLEPVKEEAANDADLLTRFLLENLDG